ncbi:MAG: hypothetical protein IKN04_11015 [Clostridia bacterium]|nr:hypothetical protein [Clostridia bacterium]
MSNIKARLVTPTGIEWMDIPFSLAAAVWKFIRGEYKNKAAAKTVPGTAKGERGMADIPKRYWETHAVPMHKITRKIIRQCRKAFQAYPVTPELVKKRKKHLKKAFDLCFALFDEIRLALNEFPELDANKFNEIDGLLNKEIEALRKGRKDTRLVNQGQKNPPHESQKNPAP